MHSELFVLEAGDGADLELQPGNRTRHPAAKSDRSRLRALEHATLQGPRAARFPGRAQRRTETNRTTVDDRIAALCLCRSWFFFWPARTCFPIFPTSSHQDSQARRFSSSLGGNTHRN